MSELIDRQAVIEAIEQEAYRHTYLDQILDIIKSMPSVQPEIRYYGQFEIKDPILISEQRWIPCSERLPEIGQSVLLSVGGMYSAEGCLREDGDWAQFRWDAIQRKDMVGAWKPLPEPYKGDGDDAKAQN